MKGLVEVTGLVEVMGLVAGPIRSPRARETGGARTRPSPVARRLLWPRTPSPTCRPGPGAAFVQVRRGPFLFPQPWRAAAQGGEWRGGSRPA